MYNFFKWFGICTNRTNICEYEDNSKCIPLNPGDLLHISPQSMPYNKELRLITLFNQQTSADSKARIEKTFLCSETKFDQVNDHFWPYLIVETNCVSRLNVFRKQQEILDIKTGEMINIYMKFDGLDRELKICCTVEYIGEVPEYGKGINFCLRAMKNFEFPKNPQTNFIGKYAKGSTTSLIIVTPSAFIEEIEFDNIINRQVYVIVALSSQEITNDSQFKQIQILNEVTKWLDVLNVGNIQVRKNTGAIRKNLVEKIKAPEKISLRFNNMSMTCPICRKDCAASSGILLANCEHMFCYECLISRVNLTSGDMKICPFINKKYRCNSIIQMNEIICLNSEGTRAFIEKNRKHRTGSGQRPVNINTSWGCSECTYENDLNATKCYMCNAEQVRQPVDFIQCINCFDTCSQGTIFTIPECSHKVCNNCLMVYLEFQLKNDVDSVNCPIKFCDYILKPLQIFEMFIQLDRFYIKNRLNFFDICIACQVRHSKVSCKEFQQTLKFRSGQFWECLRNKYDKLCIIGDVAYCPKCQLIIIKQGHEKEYCFNCEEVFKPDNQINPWQCGICFNSNDRSSNICRVCGKIPKNKVANKIATVSCMFCTMVIQFTEGVTLSCSHFFCKACLQLVVESNEPVLRCPFPQNSKMCSTIEQYEILQIIGPEMYERHKIRLGRNIAKQMDNSVLCLDENCPGWTFKEDLHGSNIFICVVCRQPNCLACKTVHAGMTCAVYNNPVKREEFLIPKPQQYQDLLKMDDNPLIKNGDPFECPICDLNYEVGETVLSRECLHPICKECLIDHVKNSDHVEYKCTNVDYDYETCNSIIQERDIRAAVDKETYNKYLERQFTIGKNNIKNGFQCQSANCNGFWVNDANIDEQRCPICKTINCLKCEAIHPDMKCDKYLDWKWTETKKKLEEKIARGEGMQCTKCTLFLIRNSDVGILRCPKCQTEFCWVTKGVRWGPNGRGDTTGGCKCRVDDGPKCHPNCMNCN